jgi:hypothetical protein
LLNVGVGKLPAIGTGRDRPDSAGQQIAVRESDSEVHRTLAKDIIADWWSTFAEVNVIART